MPTINVIRSFQLTAPDIPRIHEEFNRLYREQQRRYYNILTQDLWTSIHEPKTTTEKIKEMWERSAYFQKHCKKVTFKTLKPKTNIPPSWKEIYARDYHW